MVSYSKVVLKDGFIYIPEPNFFPTVTNRPGIFCAGTAAGPMDIVDSILTASAAATEASAYLFATQNGVDLQQSDKTEKEAIRV